MYRSNAVRYFSVCLKCGSWFDHQNCWRDDRPRYCGRKCQRASTKARGPFKCLACGIEFFTKRSKGEGEKYCSRECAFVDSDRRFNTQRRSIAAAFNEHLKAGRYRLRIENCIQCGAQFNAFGANAMCCSKRCSAIRGLLTQGKKISDKPYHRICPICGIEWCALAGPNSSKHHCSDECRAMDAIEARRREHRIRRHRSRAFYSAVERIDPFDVFERDAWKCQGCGCWTPKELRGTYHDNAPELDHRIPRAKGGSHTMDNVQTLCRICNGLKSDMDWHEFQEKFNGIKGLGVGKG